MKQGFHTIINLLCLLFVGISFVASAQTNAADSLVEANGLRLHFVKFDTEHNPSAGLFFNSIKIENISNSPITFSPKVKLPEGWGIPKFVFLPKSVTLDPKGVKYIPFKVSIPSTALGDKKYPVKVEMTGEKGKKLAEVSSSVYISINRKWDMKVLDNKLILLRPDSSKIKFKTRLQNLGNTNEVVMLQMKIEDKHINQAIEIPPGRDTVIQIETEYKETQRKEGAQKEYVELFAETDESFATGEVPFVKFKNKYDGKNARIRPNALDIGVDNLTNVRFSRINLATNGTIEFKKQNRLIYGIDNTDLLNVKQFLSVSNIYLQYFSHKFEYSLGNITPLGQDIHNIELMSGRFRSQNGFNSISGRYKHHFNPNHRTSVGVSYNLRNPITTVSASHRARFENTLFEAGGSYTLDFFGKKSTKIIFSETVLPVHPNHILTFNMNYARETHHIESFGPLDLSHLGNKTFGESSYSLSGFYVGRINNLSYVFSSSYATPRYPGGFQGIFNASAEAIYTFPKTNHTFNFNYRYFSRPAVTYTNAVPVYSFESTIQDGRLEYEMPINRFVRLKGGLQGQNFVATRQSGLTNELLPYESNYFGAFVTTNLLFNNHSVELIGYYGLASVKDFISHETGDTYENLPNSPTAFVSMNYYSSGFTFGGRYIKGANTVVRDYELSFDETLSENIVGFISFQKFFFKQTLALRGNSSLRHDIYNHRSSLTTTPEAELFLKYGWSLYGRGTYTQIVQTDRMNGVGAKFNFVTRTKVGVRKTFDVSVMLGHHNFEVVGFEDVNGNGKRDKGEKGVSDIQVTISPVAIGKGREIEFDKTKIKPVTLFTNEEGQALFKKLPEGQHNINIRQIMSSNTQYVNTIGNNHTFQLDQNQVLNIPFAKANKVRGKVIIKQDKFAKQKLSPANIRVTATDAEGTAYNVLTRIDGTYEIPLPNSEYYVIKITNPFGKDTKLLRNNVKVTFDESEDKVVDFNFRQKQRKINFN